MAQCPACQRQFNCGAELSGAFACWCQAQAQLLPDAAASQNVAPVTCCYCPACLQQLLSDMKNRSN